MNSVAEVETNPKADPESIGADGKKKTEIIGKNLEQGSTATPFSTFVWAAMKDDWATAEAQLADDIEWHMMPNNQTRKGKADVFSFLKTSKYASQKEPIPISNRADKEWGVWEYWNVGTIDKGIVEFAKQSKWPFPADVSTIIGKRYKVPVCFIYHINAKGKIDLVREYLDVSSVLAQFK
jgi:hypothetical protein